MGKTKNVVVSGEALSKKVDKYADKKGEVLEKAKKVVHSNGKNIKEARAKFDRNRTYPLSEAISLIKEISYSKFDGTFELHIKVRKQGLSAQTTLPHAAGKTKKVVVASDNTISELESGKINFDVLLATPEFMPKLVKFARLLGPRGLMPNPKNGTLIKNVKDADKFSVSQISIKTEKDAPIIHLPVGKVSMDEKKLSENINTVLNAVGPKQIVSLHICSTMSPSVRVETL